MRTYESVLLCPETARIYADFEDLAVSVCPLCTSAYQPGCSTVVVRSTAEHQRRGVVDKETMGRYPCSSWATGRDLVLAAAARYR